MSRTTFAALLVGTLALTACGGDGGSTPTPAPSTTTAGPTPATTTSAPSSTCPAPPPAGTVTVITATVAGGKVTTEHRQWSVKLGSQVRVSVVADVADEIHVHGYDLKKDTTPGCPTDITFTANIPGTVEVELEEAGLTLFEIKAS